jgi:hypothetical protein
MYYAQNIEIGLQLSNHILFMVEKAMPFDDGVMEECLPDTAGGRRI